MICEYTLPTISCHRQQYKSRAQEYQKCTSRRKTQLSSQWQLLQLFQTLVQTGILGGRGQVRQSGRKRIDQTIRVACSRHTNLHSWHELQTSISSKVENGIGLENLHKVGILEGLLHSDEHISELLSVNNQVLTVRVQISRGRTPVLLKILDVRGLVVRLLSAHAGRYVELGG